MMMILKMKMKMSRQLKEERLRCRLSLESHALSYISFRKKQQTMSKS